MTMNSKTSLAQISVSLMLSGLLLFGPFTTLAMAKSKGPVPADAPEPINILAAIDDVFQTLPLPLGTDTSTWGVSDSELDGVGLDGSDTGDATADQAEANLACDGPNMYCVDDNKVECPNAPYTTITQALVAAGADGDPFDQDKIKVCPGTYTEQVRIEGNQYNNLRLFSRNPQQAIIQAPPAMPSDPVPTPGVGTGHNRSIVLVSEARDVVIRHFVIRGPSKNLFAGVRVDNGGSATIRQNHITEIRNIPFGALGPDTTVDGDFINEGHGVNVGRQFEGTIGTAIVRHNFIDRYQKTGVFVDNAGTFAEVRHNVIKGVGDTSDVAQNGVQVSREARSEVRHNKISDNRFGCNCGGISDFDAIGILTFIVTGSPKDQPETNVLVRKNWCFLNEIGIGLARQTLGIEVSHNRSADNNLNFDPARTNTLNGIRAYDEVGPNVPGGDARDNYIAYNKVFGNGGTDCHDDTTGEGTGLTANFWIHDMGAEDNRGGVLCKKPGN